MLEMFVAKCKEQIFIRDVANMGKASINILLELLLRETNQKMLKILNNVLGH
jgi:hypothetical protein